MPETNAGNTDLRSTNGFTNNLTIWSTHGGDPTKNGLDNINHNFPSAPADVQSTVNSAPTTSIVSNPGTSVLPANAGTSIVVTKNADGSIATVHGQIAGTSVVFNSPA